MSVNAQNYIRPAPSPRAAAGEARFALGFRGPGGGGRGGHHDRDGAPAHVRQFEMAKKRAFEQGMIEGALKDTDSIGLSDWKAYSRATVGGESIGRWTTLAPYTIARMAKIANPMLESFGYDSIGDEWSESPEKARRRYELGLALNLAKSQGRRKTD